jgi:hypothetical protein
VRRLRPGSEQPFRDDSDEPEEQRQAECEHIVPGPPPSPSGTLESVSEDVATGEERSGTGHDHRHEQDRSKRVAEHEEGELKRPGQRKDNEQIQSN